MRAADFLAPAIRQFRTQRLQALLMSLAIALGVGVVVAVAALTEASNEMTANLRNSLMEREIKVRSAAALSRRVVDDTFAAARRIGPVTDEPVTLGLAELRSARESLAGIPYVYIEESTVLLKSDDRSRPDFISASRVTAEYFPAAGLKLLSGGLFTTADYEGDGKIMIVTRRFVEELVLVGDAVGRSIRFDDGTFTIVGVVEEPSDPIGAETRVYLPLTPESAEGYSSLELTAAVADVDDLSMARAEVEAFARTRWGQGVVVEPAFGQSLGTGNTTLLLIAGFASLGLLVAALNIMNLMLVRVLKRQRDIGIRRSLGASRRMLATQVLLEALALGALGGLLGLAAGYGLLAAYDAYVRALVGGTEVMTMRGLRWASSALGVGVAIAISLLFGVYPAVVATRVRPVTALRSL